jgi:predicted nucleotidyltransferase
MLRSDTQRKILRVLAEKNKKYTVNELSEMCHCSEASISRAMKNSERYEFVLRENITGSKAVTYSLKPESPYTKSIKQFFNIEIQKERKGTVPVQIWNLLEDITSNLEKTEGFIELFLFGSYATGDYYAGSDIDLFLLHEKDKEPDARKQINKLTLDKEIQIITAGTDTKPEDIDKDQVYGLAPVRNVDTLIPLTGEIEL